MELVAGVASDVEGDLPEHEQAEGEWVDGKGKGDQREDASLDDGLERAEAVGRPWAGVMALVVDAMEAAEEFRMMDEPMRPIEIRVVHEDHHHDAAPEPAPTVVIDIPVEARTASLAERQRRRPDEPVDDDCKCGPHRLAAHVRPGGHVRDDFTVCPPATAQHVAEEPGRPGEEQVMRQVVRGDEHHRLPEGREFLGEGKGGHG